MRKIRSGKSLEPTGHHTYLILEDTGGPEMTVIFREELVENGVYPSNSALAERREYVNKALEAKGMEPLTDEEMDYMVRATNGGGND